MLFVPTAVTRKPRIVGVGAGLVRNVERDDVTDRRAGRDVGAATLRREAASRGARARQPCVVRGARRAIPAPHSARALEQTQVEALVERGAGGGGSRAARSDGSAGAQRRRWSASARRRRRGDAIRLDGRVESPPIRRSTCCTRSPCTRQARRAHRSGRSSKPLAVVGSPTAGVGRRCRAGARRFADRRDPDRDRIGAARRADRTRWSCRPFAARARVPSRRRSPAWGRTE